MTASDHGPRHEPFKTREELIAFVRTALTQYLTSKGKVFYSGFDTYLRGDIIFLGYNPGGDGDLSLAEKVSALKLAGSNEFVDKDAGWGSRAVRLRNNTRKLFDALGRNLTTQVFTSNLYFSHTRTADQLVNYPLKAACWPVVTHFLLAVPASVVLCNGHRTFYELASLIDPKAASSANPFHKARQPKSGNHGQLLMLDMDMAGKKLRLIGFPHLSRFQTAVNEADRIKVWIGFDKPRVA